MATRSLLGHAICIKSQVSQMLENIALNVRTESALRRILPQVNELFGFLATEIFLCPARWSQVKTTALPCCGQPRGVFNITDIASGS